MCLFTELSLSQKMIHCFIFRYDVCKYRFVFHSFKIFRLCCGGLMELGRGMAVILGGMLSIRRTSVTDAIKDIWRRPNERIKSLNWYHRGNINCEWMMWCGVSSDDERKKRLIILTPSKWRAFLGESNERVRFSEIKSGWKEITSFFIYFRVLFYNEMWTSELKQNAIILFKFLIQLVG